MFLRELISNASDALDKLRLAAYQDKDLEVDTSDLHIALETDADARTLTVRDNGIGMTPRRGRRPDRHDREVRDRGGARQAASRPASRAARPRRPPPS